MSATVNKFLLAFVEEMSSSVIRIVNNSLEQTKFLLKTHSSPERFRVIVSRFLREYLQDYEYIIPSKRTHLYFKKLLVFHIFIYCCKNSLQNTTSHNEKLITSNTLRTFQVRTINHGLNKILT